ncbi:MAG: CHAT domain-containing protein [Saprospiraceae bacterium]|nr:CHAT domain-containing protein [Saprospiraceae bacterium]
MKTPVIIGAFANVLEQARKLTQLDREYKEIDSLWRQDTALDYVGIPNATSTDIFKELKREGHQGRIVGFHFGGHAGNTRLLLEREVGQVLEADGEALASYLGTVKGLKLVFLNGCATAPLSDAFLASGIPAVIATRYKVQDKMAADLAINFYEEISLGKSVGQAFAAARSQINFTAESPKTVQIQAYHREIPLAGAAPQQGATETVPWGLYYQADTKPDELFLFDPPEDPSIRWQSESGKSFILRMEELQRNGQMEQFQLWLEKKNYFEKALVYVIDPGMKFSYEHQLKEINNQLDRLGRQLGMHD